MQNKLSNQLIAARELAVKQSVQMYVFKDNDTWWYSGSLPVCSEFYVIYPNGTSDMSQGAMALEDCLR